MPARPITVPCQTFAQLKRAVEATFMAGQRRAEELALPPFHTHERKLRLSAIDCPEMMTEEGKAAKRFVDGLMSRTAALTITTTKPDKYDRYLADVFLTVSGDSSAGAKTAETEDIFLNNALLENGHAIRADGSTPRDWEVA